MAVISDCQDSLKKLAGKQGYLTFDDILNAAENYSLSSAEVDMLSEAIQLLGIIVYEDVPQQQIELPDEEVQDYSRTDYDNIFTEILKIAPQLKTLVEGIKRYPAPRWGEINQLSKQIADGNMFARERLITIYMRNVLKIALSMTKQFELDLEDAISSGFIGLINAVDKFDPAGFAAFHSYASLWIQQGIQRYCKPIWIDYYFPVHYRSPMIRACQKYNQYTVGEKLDSEEYTAIIRRIATEIELPETNVDIVLKKAFLQKYGKRSLEEIIELELSSDEILPHEYVNSEEDMFYKVFTNELSVIFEESFASLTNKEVDVIRMRFGIGRDTAMTLEQIGVILDITRERVRQIEKKAIIKMMRTYRIKHIINYLYL